MHPKNRFNPTTFAPSHFLWEFDSGVATVTLNIPDRKIH